MIKKKLKEYKIQMCKKYNIPEQSLMLCDLVKKTVLVDNELPKEIKDIIEDRVKRTSERGIGNATPKVKSDVVIDVEAKIDHSKTPMKKITIKAEFEVEVPTNISAKQVEKLYSNLAKKHFENCKELVCQDAHS